MAGVDDTVGTTVLVDSIQFISILIGVGSYS